MKIIFVSLQKILLKMKRFYRVVKQVSLKRRL